MKIHQDIKLVLCYWGLLLFCGLLVVFFNSPEKINGYMLNKHIHTPNYKMSNALIIIIWAFRLFLDQPQQFSHGSKTTATDWHRSEWKEWAMTKWYNFCSRYPAFTLTSIYLRCASNISMLTVSTVGISDRVHSHWRLTSSNATKPPILAMASAPK